MRVTGNNLKSFERLLSSHLKADRQSTCSGFDPDLATSYLERALPDLARQRYENHLVECYDCRKIVASLSLAYEEEATHAYQTSASRESTRFGLFSLLATPKWALAAAALLIAIISIPVIINQNNRKTAIPTVGESVQDSRAPVSEANSSTGPADASPANAKIASNASPATVPASSPASVNGAVVGGKVNSGEAGAGVVTDELRPTPAREVDQVREEVAASKKAESPAVSQPETRADRSQPVPDTKAKANEARPDLPKVDTARAMNLPEDKGKNGEVKTLRRGTVGDATAMEKESTAAVKPIGPVTPSPSESQGTEAGRAGIAAPPPSGRDKDSRKPATSSDSKARASEVSTAKSAKPEERHVSNKTFRLIGGIWTDKSYKPDKEIPVVPLTWDTEIYKEMLTKQAGLKPYFSGFQSSDRVIVVYKGTIYKLSPP